MDTAKDQPMYVDPPRAEAVKKDFDNTEPKEPKPKKAKTKSKK